MQRVFPLIKALYEKRRDLIYTGRTLFGAKPPKGQELDDHYFGSIKPRVAAFMEELNTELWKLGILAKTEHNEVAPAQHELAPIYTTTNLATDQNQLTMEIRKYSCSGPTEGVTCLISSLPNSFRMRRACRFSASMLRRRGVFLSSASPP